MIFTFIHNNSLRISLFLKSSYKIIKRFHPIKPPKPPILGAQKKNSITKDINKGGGQISRQPSGKYSGCFRKIRKENKLPPPKKEKQDVFKKPGIKKSDFEPIRDRRPMSMPMPTQTPNLQSTTPTSSSNTTANNERYLFAPLKIITNLTKSVVTKMIPSQKKSKVEVVVENPVSKVNLPNPTTTTTTSTKTFKTHHGVSYTTTVDDSTTLDSISTIELEQELFKRQLIKEENEHKMHIETENNGTINIALSKSSRKLTPVGALYHNKLKKEHEVSESNKLEISITQEPSFLVVVPPKTSDDTYIEVSDQKHLLVVYEQSSDSYYGLGYFTRKPGFYHVHDVQFKDYQKGKREVSSEASQKEKKQYFVPFDNAQKLLNNPIKAKDGDKYIEFTGSKFIFKDILAKLKNKPLVNYNNTGVTKQEALSICIAYDKNVDSKGKHPHQNPNPTEIIKVKKEDINNENNT